MKKAKSSKLVQIDFSSKPHIELPDEICRNEKEIVVNFFRTLGSGSVNCVVQTEPQSKAKTRSTLSSVDSVPIRDPQPASKRFETIPTPDFVVSKRVEFGSVEPKSLTLRSIEITNSSEVAQAWIIQSKPGNAADNTDRNAMAFLVTRREGSLEP